MESMNKCIIIRGVPGSGKTTLISQLEKEYNKKAYICSADDYHYFGAAKIKENYKFDISNIGSAHKQCQDKFTNGLISNESFIVVDNTNIKEKDYKWYYLLAKQYNYNVIFHTILPGTIEQHFENNVHNVPKNVIENMIIGLKPVPKEINNESTIEIFYDFNEIRKNSI